MSFIIQLYKNAYAGLSREIWFLSLVVLINRSGTMVIPFMSMYAIKELHFSVIQAGIIMALFGLGSIVGAFLGGKITDKIGFQSVQLFALFGGGVIFISISFLTTFLTLSIGCFVLSCINESFRPANSIAIATYSLPENRTRSYSLNRLAINLGWALGGAIGGLLAAKSYTLIFWVGGSTNILSAIMLMIVLPYKKIVKPKHSSIREKNKSESNSAYRDKKYLFFILCTILFAFCFFQMFTIFPIYLVKQLKISEEKYGFLMAFNGLLIVVLEMILIYKLEKTRNPMRFIAYGVLLVGMAYALLNVTNGTFFIAFLSIIIITFGEMLSMPFMNTFWIGRSSDHNRGQYAAMYTMGWGIAQVSGPSTGGWVADHYGFNVLWWIILGLSAISALGFYLLTRKHSVQTVS